MPAPVHALELILPDRRRVALVDEVTIGRAAETMVRLADPTVSRLHAVIRSRGDGTAVLSDAGSSFGTWLDGQRVDAPTPVQAGSRIRLGDAELVVDRRRGDDEAGHTLVVEPSASVATSIGQRPRMRPGYALKRLDAREGNRRWVLKDLRSGRFVRLSGDDAELVSLVDGSRSLAELVGEAERLQGPGGPARLTLLLAALGARGFLLGADDERPHAGRLTRQLAWSGAADLFDGVYRHGGAALLSCRGLLALGPSPRSGWRCSPSW